MVLISILSELIRVIQSCLHLLTFSAHATASQSVNPQLPENGQRKAALMHSIGWKRKSSTFEKELSLPRCDKYGQNWCSRLLTLPIYQHILITLRYQTLIAGLRQVQFESLIEGISGK